MNKEDKKIQKHLVDEMMKVSQTNPEVILYMESLMKKYLELEQKNKDLSQQLLSKKISDKDVEYKKRLEAEQELDKYKNIIEEIQTELFDIKDMIYKPETREENIPIQRKISKIIKRLQELKGE